MNKRLFVGGLPFSATKDEITSLFGQVGTVSSVNIIMDKFSGNPKGFGFVEMGTEEEATAAVAKFNGYDMGGRTLTVAEAKPMEERRPGGGGYRGGDRSFPPRREGGRGSFGRDGTRGGGAGRRGGFSGGRRGGR
jgi:cold-inducible RNA-binding protein